MSRFFASLLFLFASTIAAARSKDSPLTPEALRPYVHEGLWETTMTMDLSGMGSGTQTAEPVRQCMTAAKTESVLKQCRDGEDCRHRSCRYEVAAAGAHSARIRVSCPTPQGETSGDFDFGWDRFEGRVKNVRNGKTLIAIRISAHRLGECPSTAR